MLLWSVECGHDVTMFRLLPDKVTKAQHVRFLANNSNLFIDSRPTAMLTEPVILFRC